MYRLGRVALSLALTIPPAAASEFLENWDSKQAGGDGVHSFSLGPLLEGDDDRTFDGSRCQNSDPEGQDAFMLLDPAQCRPWNGSDWHVHSAAESSLSSPKAFSGDGALLMGVHSAELDGSDYHTGQMSQAVSPVLRIGNGTSLLSFWHIVSLVDQRSVNSSGAVDRGVVQVVRVDVATGQPIAPWQTLQPFQNGYDATAQDKPFKWTCSFDPTDDGSREEDLFPWPQPHLGPSSTCGEQRVFSHVGAWDSNDPADLGNAQGPGRLGQLGTGVWVESRFDLAAFRGDAVRVRFLFSGIAVRGLDAKTWRSFLGENLSEGARGWIIDDFRVTGLAD